MKTPSWWRHKGPMAQLLRPISLFWRLGAMLRSAFAKVETLDIPVWCVGNVTAGGGGKTPFCLYLGEQMKQAGINAYFIARGYGGELAGPLLVDVHTHSHKEVGDEALLLAECLPTIVAHERVEAAKLAAELGAKLVIMDDGMQYPHLHPNKTFLMLKGDEPLGNGYVIPAGPLRESFTKALTRSDVVVEVDSTSSTYEGDIAGWQATTHLTLPKLANNQLIAFAGIAHPHHFRKQLQSLGLHIIEFHGFADHHPYTSQELNTLLDRAEKEGAALITTAKDAVRMPTAFREKVIVAKQSLSLDRSNDLAVMIGNAIPSPCESP